jgi:hypothetical protein
MAKDDVEKQAKYLAAENKKNDPDIGKVYWFPDETEVRLVEVHSNVPVSPDGEIEPFYFRSDPIHDLPVPSGIALIRPEEVRRVRLPAKWGNWDLAKEIG